jgi:hypothetical protein
MSGSGYEFGNLADVENFKQIIKCYLRYILISGCCHCRGKNELAYIGCYTLGCLHKVICNDSDIKIGVAVDAMLDSVGKSVQCNQVVIDNLYEGELFDDVELFEIADALNTLDSFHKQLVILYNVEMITTQQLGLLYDLPIGQIRASLELGEIQLEQESKKRSIKFENVPEMVNLLGRKIDAGVLSTIVISMGEYLDESQKQN